MTGNYNDALFRSRKLGDDVMDGELALGRVSCECILFDCVVLEMGEDVVFNFFVIGAAKRTRAEGHDLFYVLKGAVGIECRRRTIVGWKGKLGRLDRCDGSWNLYLWWIGILVTLARSEGHRKREQKNRKMDYLNQFTNLKLG